MKNICYAFIACCSFFIVQGSVAQERSFGLGLVIGEPAGISAKLWTSNYTAIDFGIGWSVGGDRFGRYDNYYNGNSRVHVHMDYVWHSFSTIHSSERYPLYYGLGARINDGDGSDASAAIRGVIGVAWLPRETSIDIFIELVPMYQITTSNGFGLDAGVGIRYFF